jgi:type I restriction enzyme S subunit
MSTGYPAYVDSGVSWLGQVPVHWEVARLRSFLSALESGGREQSDADSSTGVPSLGGEHIGKEGLLLLGNMRYVSQEYFSKLHRGRIASGDVLLVKDGATIGKVAYVEKLPFKQCGVNEHVYIMRTKTTIQPAFLYYLTRTTGVQDAIWQYVTGSAQPGLSSGFAKNIGLCVPPLSEQTVIVRYLDQADRKVRRAIRARQQLIKLLSEQKQAIIQRAVTRGLDPNVHLKPSGVPWLEGIPEHWQVLPIKRTLVSLDYGISEPSTDAGTIRVLTMGNIRDGRVTIPQSGGVSAVNASLLLESGDLLFDRTNSAELVGKVGLFMGSDSPVTFASYLVRMRPRPEYEPQYLNLVCNDVSTLSVARREAIPSLHQSNLSPTRYGRLHIPLPPLDEQRTIVEALKEKTSPLDNAIDAARREIDLLREYRTRLIADVVTGKLDVRDVPVPDDETDVPPEELESIDDVEAIDQTDDVAEGDSDSSSEESA